MSVASVNEQIWIDLLPESQSSEATLVLVCNCEYMNQGQLHPKIAHLIVIFFVLFSHTLFF